MTSLVVRILLALILLPLAGCLYLTVFVLLERSMPDDAALLFANLATGLFAILYWFCLWGGLVRWTFRRVVATVAAVPICAAVALGLGLLTDMYTGHELAMLLGGVAAVCLWLAASILLWAETPDERRIRLQQDAGEALFCPRCAYNMKGLHEARCPECGSQYTLDRLFAAQKKDRLETPAPTPESQPE